MSDNVIEFSILAKDEMTAILKAGTVALAAWTGAVSFAAKAIKDVGAEDEKMRVRMEAMLGSAAEGNKVFQDMATYASQVPHAYDEIMQSATTLSGVLKGGSEEISQMMPMIGDLAAVSGLSIQQTTDQVVRMYSAGAGAADLFRERGINAMLGFKAGVSVTAEETMRKLVAAYEDPQSKFKGAAIELGSTWDGIMSMIGDKYRAIKAQIADAGLFNYMKAVFMQIDKVMGSVLENSSKNAKSWSNYLIDSVRSIAEAVVWLISTWDTLRAVWLSLKIAWAQTAEYIIGGIQALANGLASFINMIPGIDIGPVNAYVGVMAEAKANTAALRQELSDMASETGMDGPAKQIANFMAGVEMSFTKMQEMSAAAAQAVVVPPRVVAEEMMTLMQALGEEWPNFLSHLEDSSQTFAKSFFTSMEKGIDSISKGVADVIVEGENMGQMLKGVAKNVLKEMIAMLVKVGIQRLILASVNKTATATENTSLLAGGFANTFTNAFASTAAIPIIGPALAPGVAAASLSAVQAGSIVAGASGAAIGGVLHGGADFIRKEQSYFLDEGERVLSPIQNRDLTRFLETANEGGAGGSSVSIENLNVSILPNATNADALLRLSKDEMEDLVSGPIIRALNSLTKKGISPDFIERRS